jgi:protein gp37
MVFVNSMSDLFHKEIPVAYIARVFDTIERADRHTAAVLAVHFRECFVWCGAVDLDPPVVFEIFDREFRVFL